MLGHNSILGGGGFHHVAIRVYDFEAAIRFYTDALGFTEKMRWGEDEKRGIMLDAGDGNYLEIFAGGSKQPMAEGAILHFALRTTDTDAALARARAAGAEVTMEPKTIDIQSSIGKVPIRIAFCKGPAGEVIEFFQNERT